jgi:DsbC/DsbD-like thiol-disulfide interchange protein
VPARFADGAGTSIGYKSDVVLPLSVRPRDPAKPVRLALDLRYAVCDNICIPAHAELAFALPRAAVATSGGRLGAAWARIPTVVVAPSADAPVVKSLVAQRSDGRAEVRVAIGVPQGTIIDDIFAEAPEPWLFGTPAIATVATGEIVARIPVDDSPSGEAPANLPLVLTLTGPAGAFEIKADLDARSLAR